MTGSGIRCLTWAILDNHFHMLLRPGIVSVSTLMRRLLIGYAVSHKRRHNRSGHLFQNRYKSTLCQKYPYLLELVRYIHLNPLRAGIVSDMNQPDAYPFPGHGILMGNQTNEWQDTDDALVRFGRRASEARYGYRQFFGNGAPNISDDGKAKAEKFALIHFLTNCIFQITFLS